MAYHVRGGEDSPDGCCGKEYDANVTLRYDGASWRGVCTISERSFQPVDHSTGWPPYAWNNTTRTAPVAFEPLRAPTNVSVGDAPPFSTLSGCDSLTDQENWTIVERTTHTAPRQADGSDAWHAQFRPVWPEEGDAWWDVKTGLLLAWDDQLHYGGDHGWMVDTDAPLS